MTLTLVRSQVVKRSQAGAGVAVRIEHAVYQSAKMYGRHFEEKDEILSQITRQSIDVMKVRSAMMLALTALNYFNFNLGII